MVDKLSNILDAIAIQKSMLLKTGCWPVRNPSFTYRCKYYFCWALDLSFQYFLFAELHKNFKNKEYKDMTELFSFMASGVPYLFKHLFFDLHRRKFLYAMDKLESPMFNEYPQQCDKHVKSTVKIARIIMRCYQFTLINLVLIYFLKPFLSSEMAIKFSVYDFEQYWLIFHLYQMTSLAFAIYNNTTLDILSLGIMSIGSVQFDILKDKLTYGTQWAGLEYQEIDKGVVNPDVEMDAHMDERINKYLGHCVVHHLEILDYIDAIEDAFTYYFLIQFADSVLAICNTWFQLLLEAKLLKIAFLLFYTCSLLMQLGMYCIYGDLLMRKSEEIRDACYHSNWYKTGTNVRKTLMLIMERAKRPSALTAGKFSYLNLATYVGLLKMSYSYFALMNRLYGS